MSKDRDYRLVQEYWKSKDSAKKIVRNPSVEQCIAAAEDKSERGILIKSKWINVGV